MRANGLALLPGVVVVYLGFRAGGFFPGVTGLVAAGLAVALVLRITLSRSPFAGGNLPVLAAGAGLGLLAAWTLASSWWSDAPARAILEYDRVLLYGFALVLMASMARTETRVRWLVRGLAAGIAVLCLAGLGTRLLPDAWPLEPHLLLDRLSYPLTYWNALGLVAAAGVILSFSLTSDRGEPAASRVIAAGSLPIVATTLLLTFSRGAIVVGAVGLFAAVVVGRGRALPSALLVAVATLAPALKVAYDAELLASRDYLVPAAQAQGEHVAVVVAACAVGALILRAALLRIDTRVASLHLPGGHRAGAAGLVAAVVIGVLAAVAVGVPGAVEEQVDRFVSENRVTTEEVRDRLTEPGGNGRIDLWRVAVDGFASEPVRGVGAGMYPMLWERERPRAQQVEDAHSLYAEMLAELGTIGALCLLLVVVLMLGAMLVRARGGLRALWGGLFGAALAWALHAGIDWDWEMPAVTAWVFAAGGLALAAAAGPRPRSAGLSGGARIAVALGVLLLAVLPARVALSQGPLTEAARAFARGDCPTAIDRSLDSIDALGVRHEPYVILGYCDVRLGRPDLGVRALRAAVARDPHNWETHYGLALVRGAAGMDPRPAARTALRLNPRSSLAAQAVRRFDTEDPDAWRRRALQARLPVD